MDWIHQTRNTCGQACVAMIAGITLEKAIQIVGKRGATRTKDLVQALRAMGYTCPDRLQRIDPKKPIHKHPAPAILNIRFPGRNYGHWVILAPGAKIYDPEPWHPPTTTIDYLSILASWGARFTSYLPIGGASDG